MTAMLLGSSFLTGMLVLDGAPRLGGGPDIGGGPDRILPRDWGGAPDVPSDTGAAPPPPPRVGMVPVPPTLAPRLTSFTGFDRIGVWPVNARPTPDSFTLIRLCLKDDG